MLKKRISEALATRGEPVIAARGFCGDLPQAGCCQSWEPPGFSSLVEVGTSRFPSQLAESRGCECSHTWL